MGLLKDVPVGKVKEFEIEFLEYLDLKHRDILDQLSEGILNNNITDILEKTALELVKKYKP
jgi:F-type H+-transporting ATPase subunit alpha